MGQQEQQMMESMSSEDKREVARLIKIGRNPKAALHSIAGQNRARDAGPTAMETTKSFAANAANSLFPDTSNATLGMHAAIMPATLPIMGAVRLGREALGVDDAIEDVSQGDPQAAFAGTMGGAVAGLATGGKGAGVGSGARVARVAGAADAGIPILQRAKEAAQGAAGAVDDAAKAHPVLEKLARVFGGERAAAVMDLAKKGRGKPPVAGPANAAAPTLDVPNPTPVLEPTAAPVAVPDAMASPPPALDSQAIAASGLDPKRPLDMRAAEMARAQLADSPVQGGWSMTPDDLRETGGLMPSAQGKPSARRQYTPGPATTASEAPSGMTMADDAMALTPADPPRAPVVISDDMAGLGDDLPTSVDARPPDLDLPILEPVTEGAYVPRKMLDVDDEIAMRSRMDQNARNGTPDPQAARPQSKAGVASTMDARSRQAAGKELFPETPEGRARLRQGTGDPNIPNASRFPGAEPDPLRQAMDLDVTKSARAPDPVAEAAAWLRAQKYTPEQESAYVANIERNMGTQAANDLRAALDGLK